MTSPTGSSPIPPSSGGIPSPNAFGTSGAAPLGDVSLPASPPPGMKLPPTAQDFAAIYKPPAGTTAAESAEYFKAYQTLAPSGNWNVWPPAGQSLTDVQKMVTDLPQTLKEYQAMPAGFQYPQIPLQPGQWVGNLVQFYDGFTRSIVQTTMDQLKSLKSAFPSTGWV